MLTVGGNRYAPLHCVWRSKCSSSHENTVSVKPVLAAQLSFLDCSSSVCNCPCNCRLGGVSRATLALPGSLTLGSELSQQRSEILFNGLSKLCLLMQVNAVMLKRGCFPPGLASGDSVQAFFPHKAKVSVACTLACLCAS